MATFNKERAVASVQRKRVKGGLHAGIVFVANKHEKEGVDDLKAAITLRVIKDIEDPNDHVPNAEVRCWPTFPLANDDVDGHVEPEWSHDRFIPWMACIFPEEVNSLPYKKTRGRSEPYYYEGEEIERSEYQRCKDEVVLQSGEKAAEVWGADGENLSSMVGKPFYFRVTWKEGSDFPNIYPVPHPYEDDELVDTDDCIETVGAANGQAGPVTTKGQKGAAKRKGARAAKKKKQSKRGRARA